MNELLLIWLEIVHRKLSFVLMLTVLVIAVAIVVCSITLVHGQRLRAEAQVAQLDDEIRRITKNLGFNVDILPNDLNRSDLFAHDFGEATMSYELVDRLANSHNVFTINHLRPSLIRKVDWPEHDREVILMGVSSVVPWAFRKNPKIPLENAVPDGKIVVGAILAEQLGLKPGTPVVFRGEPLIVEKVHPPRGSADDITIWIDLAKAQDMLQLPNRINMIQALECNCDSIDRLGEIRQEIKGVLGDEVQVIERTTIALARAEAREQVKAQGAASLNRMQQHATLLTLLLATAAAAIIGLLTFINTRERRYEIGVLRAIGASTGQIMLLFIGKALILGLAGSLAGCVVGFFAGLNSKSMAATETSIDLTVGDLLMPELFITVVVSTTMLAVFASWIPAAMVAALDPAEVMSEQ